jgi:multidrug efflux pump subunit AcrA (membrane-fusion protein)
MTRRDITTSDQEDLKRFAVLSQQADERSELIVPPPPVIQRGALGLIAGALLITLIVLYFGKTSVVVPATGRIVPEGDIRVVEALEGGVVSRVAVQPGDRLKKGDAFAKNARVLPGNQRMSQSDLRVRAAADDDLGAGKLERLAAVRSLAPFEARHGWFEFGQRVM